MASPLPAYDPGMAPSSPSLSAGYKVWDLGSRGCQDGVHALGTRMEPTRATHTLLGALSSLQGIGADYVSRVPRLPAEEGQGICHGICLGAVSSLCCWWWVGGGFFFTCTSTRPWRKPSTLESGSHSVLGPQFTRMKRWVLSTLSLVHLTRKDLG